jgi:hypothetical protein
MSGMKASSWGARLMALPSTPGCLGAIDLRPSLGQHASGGPARLFAPMQDIWMSLHSVRSKIDVISPASSSTGYGHRNYSYDIIVTSSRDVPFKTLLGILRFRALLI